MLITAQIRCIVLAGLLLLVSAVSAATPTLDDIAAERAAITSDSSLTEENRSSLLANLDRAQNQLEAANRFREQTAQFKAVMSEADNQTASFNQKLKDAQEAAEDAPPTAPTDASAADLEGQITLLLAERQALSERRTQLLTEVDELPARRKVIKTRLVELQSQAQTPVSESLPEIPRERVPALLAQAQLLANTAEKEALETEVLSEPSRGQIAAAERTWLGQAIESADSLLAVLNDSLEAARSSATAQQLETTYQLQEQLATQDPRLKTFARHNRELAQHLQQTAALTDTARNNGLSMQRLLESIEQDAALMQRRLDVAGRKELLGRVMITRLSSLPDIDELQRDMERRNELIASTSLTQIDTEEDFRALNERQEYLDVLVPDLASWDKDSRNLVNELVDQRSALLEDNLKGMSSLLSQLLDNNDNTARLIDSTEEFHRFLLGNLLWVRNFSYVDIGMLSDQLKNLLAPRYWQQLPRQLSSGYQEQPWSSALLILFLASLLLRWRLRPTYNELLSRPILVSGSTLWHILAGLICSVLLVLPWPLLVYIAGYLLKAAQPASELSDALAEALKLTARVLLALLFTRLLCSRLGVGRRFLKWDARMLDSIRNELNWAGPVVGIALVIDLTAFYLETLASGGPLGALATAVIAGSIIVFCVRLMQQDIFSEDRTLIIALRVISAVAAAVIGMQLVGLLFAGEIYLLALGRSIVLLGAIKLIGDVLERWLLILRSRIERQAREEQKNQLDEGDESSEETDDNLDLSSLSEAHRKLLAMGRFISLAVGLYIIWSPLLPALSLLDSAVLWQVTDSTASDGALRSITLFDLFVSGVILTVTALVTRHLPSLSEVFMREWFNISAGARYASSILMQYLVIAIGASMFLSTIGWEWGKVQWLVAALGVGIGFGLQEIVANFISGIIILFERPVRVGDIISVGQSEGVVRKINPRATVIETFDNKEHLIPNKELITGQVINWSLSETAVRIVVPVGVAYGSDVRKAMDIMLETALEVDLVLAEPEPVVTFEDFGDNALVLWLRCFGSDNRPRAWTELRTIIYEKFTAAGIVIAFPQRDIHLDTSAPLQIELSNPDR
ncbi:mechanosensitive ion channel [Halioglobus maricola]|uniref:Mechanosensitive ion channel n=1 Tax=Halioglobus maricola TaxID=2601894 RepID=A0A5P9NL78_9GAMM|nr:mechanosensitive ion channel domain-containing protein [Halioglobus maricola]QFU76623.1 mechanosensitive ion channel [Halioglobus maricola]